MASIPTSEEIIASFDIGTLAQQMASRFGLKDKSEIQQVEARCIDLHNSGRIDLVGFAESGGLSSLKAIEFFMAMHFFCRILPDLEATSARVMRCVEALVARGGEDGAANEPNSALKEWCAKKTKRAQDVIAAARSGDDLASRNLTFALEAVNAISEARQIALAYDDARRASAITALGRIEGNDLSSCTETFAVFNQLLNGDADDSLRANLLHATAAILARNAEAVSFDVAHLISKLVENAGDFTVHQAAQVLWLYSKALNPEMIASLMKALEGLNPANKGTVRAIDCCLRTLLDGGYAEPAILYFTQVLSERDTSLRFEEFESFIPALLAGPADVVSRVIVQWLLQGTPNLCEGLANSLIGETLEGPPLDLLAKDLSIPPVAQLFICRKAIGWFFFKPTTAASVIVSVLRCCDAETAKYVADLLGIILVNYTGVRGYLEGIASNDAAKTQVIKCLKTNDEHLAGIEKVPLIKELQPSEHQRWIQRVRMSNKMREINKQAHKQSIFYNLVKRSVLLYGGRSLTFVNEGNVRRPVEMDLKPHGVSIEIPRMEIIDPVGLDEMLRRFRVERMKS